MKGKNIHAVLMACCIIAFWLFDEYYVNEDNGVPSVEVNTVPIGHAELLPGSTTGSTTSHTFYTLSYHEAYEQAEWVAYWIQSDYLMDHKRKRPYFILDPKVTTRSADWKNYKGSGYDRGHLCAAGDMAFSEEAYRQTFFTSNISPQRSDFNAGVWNRLEQRTRYWAKRYDGVFVITGGVLGEGLDRIGYEGVAVPNHFYKVLLRQEGNQFKVIAFLVPHVETKSPLQHFVVSVDSLERLTGINFFERMPDSLQTMLEGKPNREEWNF
ncbi:MAG: DNA/RNA non-specific endonuclease [Sediminicola sp.]